MFIGLLSQRRKRKILTLKYILVVSWMEGNAIVREKIDLAATSANANNSQRQTGIYPLRNWHFLPLPFSSGKVLLFTLPFRKDSLLALQWACPLLHSPPLFLLSCFSQPQDSPAPVSLPCWWGNRPSDATQLADLELKLSGLDHQARYLPTRYNSRRWVQEQSIQRVMPVWRLTLASREHLGEFFRV